jgi:hypothetical protein
VKESDFGLVLRRQIQGDFERLVRRSGAVDGDQNPFQSLLRLSGTQYGRLRRLCTSSFQQAQGTRYRAYPPTPQPLAYFFAGHRYGGPAIKRFFDLDQPRQSEREDATSRDHAFRDLSLNRHEV